MLLDFSVRGEVAGQAADVVAFGASTSLRGEHAATGALHCTTSVRWTSTLLRDFVASCSASKALYSSWASPWAFRLKSLKLGDMDSRCGATCRGSSSKLLLRLGVIPSEVCDSVRAIRTTNDDMLYTVLGIETCCLVGQNCQRVGKQNETRKLVRQVVASPLMSAYIPGLSTIPKQEQIGRAHV